MRILTFVDNLLAQNWKMSRNLVNTLHKAQVNQTSDQEQKYDCLRLKEKLSVTVYKILYRLVI